MKTEDIRIVLCTFPDLDKARQIGTLLVESQLAACVNLVPQVESIYQWNGETRRDSEVLAIFKTHEFLISKLEAELIERHPYDVPEFLVLPVDSGAEGYVKWIRKMTN
ncbi:MAG: divalent-cation tolerance protein CutA [Verrucomicrobiales bacterium]